MQFSESTYLFSLIICSLFHRKHRKRTGKREILKRGISYEIKCEKCGLFDREIYWLV